MRKVSLRARLFILFTVTSIVPILFLGLFSYFNINKGLRDNMEVMTDNNLLQIDNNLNIWLESYEDLLYQIYTQDNMVTWINNLNEGNDEAVTINQMRRFLSSLLYTKEYIRAITIITPVGDVVTYEQMTPATYKSSWLDEFSLDQDELYQEVAANNGVSIFPTEYGTNFANRDYYLFHMAHRIIDYHDIDRECGIVIMSIDEEFLQNVCTNPDPDSPAFTFIVDDQGRIISYGDQSENIGSYITRMGKTEDERREDYLSFIKEQNGFLTGQEEIYLHRDEELGWEIVNLADMGSLVESQRRQTYIVFFFSLFILGIAALISSIMSRNLLDSVRLIIDGMKQAQDGDLSVRIRPEGRQLAEVQDIADGFNDTLVRLDDAINRQREAQIVAMEAQINPHFLYNTLDTINWMAIDKEEYDISNSISALANILRYAIVNSNGEVTVQDETDWLKKYIYLQQYRLKNQFSCNIDVDPEVREAVVHKLLLQPFVENAILHGFENTASDAVLNVEIRRKDDKLEVVIADNGSGMSPDTIAEINNGEYMQNDKKHGIGMKNAITRMNMYYGRSAEVMLYANEPSGVRVVITIPYREKAV